MNIRNSSHPGLRLQSPVAQFSFYIIVECLDSGAPGCDLLSSGHMFVHLLEDQVEFIIFGNCAEDLGPVLMDCFILLNINIFRLVGLTRWLRGRIAYCQV